MWLVCSMETGICKPYMFLPSAKDVWEVDKKTYSDTQNSFQIFGLKSKLWHAKQGNRSAIAYYNEMLTLWQELDLCYDDNWRCTEDSVLFLKREEARQGIMMGKTPRSSESKGSALATRNLDEGKWLDKVPSCDHYSDSSDHMTGESSLFSSYSPCAGFELGEDDWQF
ncbi:hypothetical protein KIW84_054954 [Lathyrus oleraceus]|uniref:Retrotransposon gag domain-containing protein n=1 Tax=Pisum sativum TaxID=3888 RepID=A0A9D4WZ75_PEA|nr:hypothetical protein KIW84_054954 [Pisum sativum]